MADTMQRDAHTTSSRKALPGLRQPPPQHTINTPVAHYDDKHAAGTFFPYASVNTSPLSRCSSTASDMSFCSLITPPMSSADSGEDKDDDQDCYDSVYEEDEESDDDDDDDDDEEIVVELISILKKPRDPIKPRSFDNATENEDSDEDDEGSECDVVFERNVTFDDPLATDMMTGDVVKPSRLSREEWTAMKLRESIERGGFLVDCKNGLERGFAEDAGLLGDDEDEEENVHHFGNNHEYPDEDMHDSDSDDVEMDDVVFEGVVFEVDAIVCHTQTQPQMDLRHRSTAQIGRVDL